MSLKAVSLQSIPGGTPLKDFVKFQGNCTLKSAKIPPSMVLSCHNVCSGQETKGIEVFQSTLISSNAHIQEFFDISEIKASEGMLGRISSCQKTKHMSRSAVQKRKACEPLSHESPAKIFSRMKQKAALVKEKNKPPEAKLLDTKHTADYTPERQPAFLPSSEKIPIVEDKQKTKVDEDFLEESHVKTVSVTDFTAVNKTTCTTVISPLLLESPNKFFSRFSKKKDVIYLNEWGIRVINDNTAVCLEGIRSMSLSLTSGIHTIRVLQQIQVAHEVTYSRFLYLIIGKDKAL
ncbi:PREDICTED: mis18-binding protein 1-like [Thamnophis sirtalis]|uniref:Mis18-binding protein 1-like n=1 Tax=Thamnophis sirtalis TaxID=35019 RepID=A0A6I9YU47_9SAUR|nr:PREDICTED: mis18-binding protein 1-like [Thamnophis sirtalis]